MRRWMIGTVVIVMLLLAVPLTPAQTESEIFTDPSGTVISADNASDIVQVARYGRGWLSAIAWCPEDDRLIAAGSAGIWLYDLDDLTATLSPLTDHTTAVYAVACAPDGDEFASGAADSSLRRWSAEGDALTISSVPYSATFAPLVYSPSGEIIATASGADILLWNSETGEQLRELTGHERGITALAFNSEGMLASSALDGTVRLWDTGSGTQVQMLTLDETTLHDLAWSPDDEQLAVSSDFALTIIDVESGETATHISQNLTIVLSIAWSPDGSQILAGDERGLLHIYDVEAATIIDSPDLEDGIKDLAYSPDGDRYAILTTGNTLSIRSADDHSKQDSLSNFHTPSADVAVFSPGDERIAVAYASELVQQFDLETGEVLLIAEGSTGAETRQTLAYSPDGSQLAVMDGFGVRVQDADSGDETAYFDATNLIETFTWSPDGSLIVTGDAAGNLEIWDTDSGERLLQQRDHTGSIRSIIFNEDGSLILTAADDGTARLYGLPDDDA